MKDKKDLIDNYLNYENTGTTYSWIDKDFVENESNKDGYKYNLMGYIFVIYYYKRDLYNTFGRKKARKIFKKALSRYRRFKNEMSRM